MTYAWSREKVFEHNTIYQYENDIPVNGIGIDRCELNGYAGGWRVGMVIKLSTPQLPQDVAANIIDSYLKKAWDDCEAERIKAEQEGRTADAEAWKGLRDWQHHLAWRSCGQLLVGLRTLNKGTPAGLRLAGDCGRNMNVISIIQNLHNYPSYV